MTKAQAERAWEKAKRDHEKARERLDAARLAEDRAYDVYINASLLEQGQGQSWDYFNELHRGIE